MAKFVLKRLAMLPLVLAGVTLLLFGLFQTLSPEMRASLYIKDPRQLSALESVIATHGLRDPFPSNTGAGSSASSPGTWATRRPRRCR